MSQARSTRLANNTVFVLGAGFTKAFVPDAPLLVDNYAARDLLHEFEAFPTAKGIMENLIDDKNPDRLDLELAMTRTSAGMPYDSEIGATEQLSLLFTRLKTAFMEKLRQARKGKVHRDDLDEFSRLCARRGITCVTFNYDDMLDESLYTVKPGMHGMNSARAWNPDSGYGFLCRPATSIIRDLEHMPVGNDLLLLKLHGSVNWWVRLGHPRPYSVDTFVHKGKWWRDPHVTLEDLMNLDLHLERSPFIVPPVLTKEELSREPVLQLIWTRAYQALRKADLVVFVGYSFPVTDIAARFLFTESIQPGTRLKVVNLARNKTQEEEVRANYRKAFPDLRHDQFTFEGALEWSRKLTNTYLRTS